MQTQDTDSKYARFKQDMLLAWPELGDPDFDTAELVFKYEVDPETLEEFLIEIEENLAVEFFIDLKKYYPVWYSILYIFPNLRHRRVLGRYLTGRFDALTPLTLWQHARDIDRA